jgi:hypothetical protein
MTNMFCPCLQANQHMVSSTGIQCAVYSCMQRMLEPVKQPIPVVMLTPLNLLTPICVWLQYGGKRLADVVEAMLGAAYLHAATPTAGGPLAALQGGAAQPLSDAGLSAAAQLCELLGLLPRGMYPRNLLLLLNSCNHAGGCFIVHMPCMYLQPPQPWCVWRVYANYPSPVHKVTHFQQLYALPAVG